METFWAKFERPGPDECWIWLKSKNSAGYGTVRWKRSLWLSHRLAWTLTNGPIPEGYLVLHKCDNPPCGNPLHLWTGTYLDNAHDREQKQRGNHACGAKSAAALYPELYQGERNGFAKLNKEQVLRIRYLVEQGMTQTAVAKLFNVRQTAVQKIVRRENWKHVA